MSGITPLIDTLLHQVLGKRVDIPAPKDMNDPVKPVVSADGPRAVHSDSRLDPRSQFLTPLSAAAPRQSGSLPSSNAGLAQQGAADAGASAATRLSFAARVIANLLASFPSAPSVIQTAAPLLAQEDTATANAVASRLQGSIRDSGLFYESHLVRWYRGELSRQQLDNEPQMRLAAPQLGSAGAGPAALAAAGQAGSAAALRSALSPAALSPAAPDSGPGGGAREHGISMPGTGPGVPAPLTPPPPAQSPSAPPPAGHAIAGLPPSGESSPGDASAPARDAPTLAPMATKPAIAGHTAGTNPWAAPGPQTSGLHVTDDGAPPLPARSVEIADALQGVVRHQLELLATPVLRWEGDVWSGIFVALMIQLPQQPRDQRGQDPASDSDTGDGDEDSWRSELAINLQDMGRINVSLQLKGELLRLGLQVESPAMVQHLEAGRSTLVARLEGCGYSSPDIRIEPLVENGHGG